MPEFNRQEMLVGYCHGVARDEIAAQAAALSDFAAEKSLGLILHREVRRPGKMPGKAFEKALSDADRLQCPVAFATLRDLMKQPSFFLQLRSVPAGFLVLDDLTANPATLPLLLRVSKERETRSIQIRAALAAKRRTLDALSDAEREALVRAGETARLGGKPVDAAGRSASARVRRSAAEARETIVIEAIRTIWADGITANADVAKRLNDRGVLRARGGEWTGIHVSRLTTKLKRS